MELWIFFNIISRICTQQEVWRLTDECFSKMLILYWRWPRCAVRQLVFRLLFERIKFIYYYYIYKGIFPEHICLSNIKYQQCSNDNNICIINTIIMQNHKYEQKINHYSVVLNAQRKNNIFDAILKEKINKNVHWYGNELNKSILSL